MHVPPRMRLLSALLLTTSLGLRLALAPAGAAEPTQNAAANKGAAADKDTKASTSAELLAGHSMHGEAFNEGPRQAAYLMPGMSNVQFDVSTSNAQAKKFFNQGVAQLHGFWYYEAERSFRQAAALDPECAMCYWGMALANVNNTKRAGAFIAQAVQRKSNASPREQLYIEAAARRFPTSQGKSADSATQASDDKKSEEKKPSKKEIAQRYTQDLEAIVLKYPEDVEARALLALQLWENERSDLPIVSHVAINAVLQDVFDKNPLHPAHHYRIHLWDKRDPSQALHSAAMCGPSLPGIAHMWHMPGHTYSNLNRFQDAVWQQEASARVDHAHMMRDRIMPDQIHNFAHNNEWMIRNLIKIGRVKDAVDLASNMVQLPRHPKYNTLKSGSAKYGRERLLQTLAAYRLWSQTLDAFDSGLIESGDDPKSQVEGLRARGIAQALLDNADAAQLTLSELSKRLLSIQQELKTLADDQRPSLMARKPDDGYPPAPECQSAATSSKTSSKASSTPSQCAQADSSNQSAASDEDKKKAAANRARREKERKDRQAELEPQQSQLQEAIAAIEAARASRAGQWGKALELFEKAGSWDKLLKVEWLAKADKYDDALKLVDAEIKSNPGTVLPRAVSVFIRWQTRGAAAAKDEFELLREAACVSDLGTPMLSRLEPLASELGLDRSWAKPYRPAVDTGSRPDLDTLGPYRYAPYEAPTWQALDRDGQTVGSDKYAGKPTVVIFYLGFGCLHCMEQLQKFSPAIDKFRHAGMELIAISSETKEQLAKGMDNYDKPLAIPLLADSQLKAFKEYRCYDDFEKQPLHGTFLIDGQGNVLWQDISYEPFMDEEFLLKEAQRLLKVRS